ncbi:MAG: phage protein Gp36 family protein [Acidobacteriota bacterium]
MATPHLLPLGQPGLPLGEFDVRHYRDGELVEGLPPAVEVWSADPGFYAVPLADPPAGARDTLTIRDPRGQVHTVVWPEWPGAPDHLVLGVRRDGLDADALGLVLVREGAPADDPVTVEPVGGSPADLRLSGWDPALPGDAVLYLTIGGITTRLAWSVAAEPLRVLDLQSFFRLSGGADRVRSYLDARDSLAAQDRAAEQAIRQGEERVLSLLAGRYSDEIASVTPSTAPAELRGLVAAIALYDLVSLAADRVPEILLERRSHAMAQVRDLARGHGALGWSPATPADRTAPRVLAGAPGRSFATPDVLRALTLD